MKPRKSSVVVKGTRLRGHSLLDAVISETSQQKVETVEVKAEVDPGKSGQLSNTDDGGNGDDEILSLKDAVQSSLGVKKTKKTEANIDPNDLDPTVIPTGKGIAAKFERYDTALKAKDAEINELKKKLSEAPAESDPKEHPEFKKILEENNRLLDIVQQVQLTEHPRFKEKYETPKKKIYDEIVPILEEIPDDAKRLQVGIRLDQIRNIPRGAKNNPAFNKALSEVATYSGLDDANRSDFLRLLKEERRITAEQEDALSQWKETRQSLSSEDQNSRKGLAAAATKEFDRMIAHNEAIQPQRMEFLQKAGLMDFYNEDVLSKRPIIKSEIERASIHGVITPGILELVQMGTELPFQARVNTMLKSLLQETNAKLQAAEKRLSNLLRSSPNDGQRTSDEASLGDDGQPKSLRDAVRSAYSQ